MSNFHQNLLEEIMIQIGINMWIQFASQLNMPGFSRKYDCYIEVILFCKI